MFVTAVRRQLELVQLEEDDEEIQGLMLAKINNALPCELQTANKARTIPEMLTFIDQVSKKLQCEGDIVDLLRREMCVTDPRLMWHKYQTYLKGLKPGQTEEERLQGVRSQVYLGTPFHDEILRELRMPEEYKLDKLCASWANRMRRYKGRHGGEICALFTEVQEAQDKKLRDEGVFDNPGELSSHEISAVNAGYQSPTKSVNSNASRQ